jgi:hypothetical protein
MDIFEMGLGAMATSEFWYIQSFKIGHIENGHID